jgi:hypothetical protein
MTNDEAKKLLIAYNEYRRGNTDDFPKPKDIGIAIETAIQSLDKKPNQYAANIRDAAINWPKYLGVVECGMLDFAFNCSVDGFMHWKLRENQTIARTFMLLVAEALES